MSASSTVHNLWTTAAGGPGSIPAPHIEYTQLAPILVVFGAAVVGILLEAFLPRRARYATQLTLSTVALIAAFATVLYLAADGYATGKAHLAAMGAIAIDGPALFLQGTILLIALIA